MDEEELLEHFSNLKVWGNILRPETIHRGRSCLQVHAKWPHRPYCSHTCLTDDPEIDYEHPDICALDWSMEDEEKKFERFTGAKSLLKENIDNRIILLLEDVWEQAHDVEPAEKLNFTKYIIAITVLSELWGFLTKLYDEEYSRTKLKPPRNLYEKFSKVLFIFEDTDERYHITLKTFTKLTKLRTAVIADVRVLYRQHYHPCLPEHTLPKRGNRYNPYDVDWLSSSARILQKTSPWAHVSRINQWIMINHRVSSENVRLYKGTPPEYDHPDGGFKFDRTTNYHEIDPDERDDKTMQSYEQNECMKTLNVMHLLELKDKDSEVLWQCKARYGLLNSMHWILMKKRHFSMEMVRPLGANSIKPLNLLQQIATLAILETQLLLICETFAEIPHRDFGMFGESCPIEVSQAIDEATYWVNTENCETYPIDQGGISLLDTVRNKVKDAIKTFYLTVESRLEGVFVDHIWTSKAEAEKITLKIPEDMNFIKRRIIVDLVWQNIEMKRLAHELEMAHAVASFQTEELPHKFLFQPFVPGIHYSNFREVIFRYKLNRWHRRADEAKMWEYFHAHEEKYPSEVIYFIKSEVHSFIRSTFGRDFMNVKDYLASGLCYAIIENVRAKELDSMFQFTNRDRCSKRIIYAAQRCIGVFKSVLSDGDAVVKCIYTTERNAVDTCRERLRRDAADGNVRKYIPNDEMSYMVYQFVYYMEYIGAVARTPFP